MTFFHLNILFLLGLALFGGAIGGRLFQKLRIPQVVGYIAIGILIGESGLKIVNHETILKLQLFNYFALGLIGFMVGSELKKSIFAKYGRQFFIILLCEGIAPFILVTVLIGVVGGFFFEPRLAWALGILFGAIASATDPASTTEVFREFKTKGPLTTTVTGIVALDDGLALILFSIASSIAAALTGKAHEGVFRSFIHPIYDIGGSILVGVLAGWVLAKLLKKYSESQRLLAFTLGTVLLATGLSLAFNFELLLVSMTVGVVVVNILPQKSKEVFKLVSGFTPPTELRDNTPLDDILQTFSNTANLYYPVIDNENRLTGIISVDSIKNTIGQAQLSGLLLADDLKDPVVASVSEDSLLSDAEAVFNKFNLEYLPVVDAGNKLAGFIEKRMFNKMISTKLMELQKQADSLEVS